jgi:hypothetical protein
MKIQYQYECGDRVQYQVLSDHWHVGTVTYVAGYYVVIDDHIVRNSDEIKPVE